MSIFPTTILLASDESREAELAATAAADLVKSTGSELHVVYVDELRPTVLAQPEVEPEVEPEANPVRVFWYGLKSAFASVLVALGVGALVLIFDVSLSGRIHPLFAIIPAVIAAVVFDRVLQKGEVEEADARQRERGGAQFEREARDLLDRQVKRIEEAGATVKKAHLRRGRADEEIVELADEVQAGLIVIGSRGQGGIRRALMGSVSDSVVRHAHTPVLTVRE
jgi:nucleotide-binding universal stress UspA family protein